MLTTEEIIQDNKEIQEGLIIPYRQPNTATRAKVCTCGRCKLLNYSLEGLGGLYGPEEAPVLSGKISTKIQR